MPNARFREGQFVYHPKHGTARFVGQKVIDGLEYLELEFAGGDKVFVPVDRSQDVEPVPTDGPVRLDKIRSGGLPPPPPRAVLRQRASTSAGGPADSADIEDDPLLQAAQNASPERRATVERARQNWIDRLIDLSRRNRLLFYQPLKVRTVELTAEQFLRALPLVSGESVTATKIFGAKELVPSDEERELYSEIEDVEDLDLGVMRRLQEIQKRGTEDFEERGLETIYLTYGMATWRPEDEGRPPQAPVVLIPLTIAGKGNRLALYPSADIEINLALTHVLEEAGADGLAESVEALLAETDELAGQHRLAQLFNAVEEAGRAVPGFRIESKAVIGNFAFQKLAMVRDLQRWKDRMAGHDIVAGVAGDIGAKRELSESRTDVDVRELDRRPPEKEFLVLDADSSQLKAIETILRGDSGVVIGPPGTGKSQTIANLICELIAHGKRVLFVAEKRAALEVVKSRLEHHGLGDMVLDLHGAVSRKQIMAQFSLALEAVREAQPPRVEDLHRAYVSHRNRLNEYVEQLHLRREPTGYSAYELLGHFLSLQATGAHSNVRWRGKELQRLSRETIASIEEVLRRSASEPGLFLRSSISPWSNAELADRDAVETAVQTADELATRALPNLAHEVAVASDALGLRRPNSLAALAPVLAVIDAGNQLFARYRPELFSLNLNELREVLTASESPLNAGWAWLTNSRYRAAKRQLLSVRIAKAKTVELRREVVEAIDLQARWHELSHTGALPASYPNSPLLHSAHEEVMAKLAVLGRYVLTPDISAGFVVLDDFVARLASDRLSPTKIPALRAYQKDLVTLGGGPLLEDLKATAAEVDSWIPSLRYGWLASCIDQLLLEEPELAVFNGREHDKAVSEFIKLDKERLRVAVARVKRAYGESVINIANQNPEQHLLLKKQAALRTRHLPFRELVARAPVMVTSVKPCWMASPLAVSQVLGGSKQYFDVVIFDEASQVMPEDAITAILRGKSVVVAGDPNQLPPTQFFAAERDDDGDPGEDTEGFESILDVMVSFLPQSSLEWHYRSRDERLIAFSNHYVYDDRLVTFPSSGDGQPALSHVLVEQTRLDDAEEQSSSAEVQRVAEVVLDHAKNRPEMSLGVIAMGIKHSNRIDAELARARRDHPELDGFFDAHPEEKFFVKNLERVQGDERDAIILSIGYGKDSSGKLPYRFGPLLSEGGHRRLNVAVTRAKHTLTLVSSFSHHDMDPARSNRRGVELLRLYLEYADSSGRVFGDGGPLPVERNDFEIQVQGALEHAGLHVLPQFGASKYRIDMVIQHPEEPGRFILAIECDGATYHSSPTARDRDRLRQEHLEARGWRFVRVWSTDWFTRRDEELSRLLGAYQDQLLKFGLSEVRGRYGLDPIPPPIDAAPPPSNELESVQRPPRPNVPRGRPISEYTQDQLRALARWVRSDGVLRTDDELLTAMTTDLRFDRRGRRIEAALLDAIFATR
jgi:very-short-patch-repair endonuclease